MNALPFVRKSVRVRNPVAAQHFQEIFHVQERLVRFAVIQPMFFGQWTTDKLSRRQWCSGIDGLATYVEDLFQDQRVHPSTSPLDVQLAELVPVGRNRADFPDREIVAHPMEKVLDPTLRRLSERMIGIDLDHLTVPGESTASVKIVT